MYTCSYATAASSSGEHGISLRGKPAHSCILQALSFVSMSTQFVVWATACPSSETTVAKSHSTGHLHGVGSMGSAMLHVNTWTTVSQRQMLASNLGQIGAWHGKQASILMYSITALTSPVDSGSSPQPHWVSVMRETVVCLSCRQSPPLCSIPSMRMNWRLAGRLWLTPSDMPECQTLSKRVEVAAASCRCAGHTC